MEYAQWKDAIGRIARAVGATSITSALWTGERWTPPREHSHATHKPVPSTAVIDTQRAEDGAVCITDGGKGLVTPVKWGRSRIAAKGELSVLSKGASDRIGPRASATCTGIVGEGMANPVAMIGLTRAVPARWMVADAPTKQRDIAAFTCIGGSGTATRVWRHYF